MPNEAALKKTLAKIEDLGGTVTRADLIKFVPASYVKAATERAETSSLEPKRFAAGRLLWRLAHLGHVCMGEKMGSEQCYVLRKEWFPRLPWPKVSANAAVVELARDYLRVYGPATPHDLAHFFNAKVTEVRRWLESLHDELATVECGDRANLLILGEDVSTLRKKTPNEKEWPLRLLPMWESMLMAHADKSWTVPEESEKKQVWRKAAMVAPVVLSRGRVVATWSQKATKKKLKVQIQSLSGWRKTKHLKAAQAEVEALAAHLEIPGYEIEVV
jgi:hypothetical protein